MSPGCVLLLVAGVLLLAVPGRAAIFGSDCGHADSHNFHYGVRRPNDRMLYMTEIHHEFKLLRKVIVEEDFPVKGQPPLGQITYIEVVDLRNDGTGGCVYIHNGGVGQNFVSLIIKSQRNRGIDFLIRIFGI